MGLLSSIFGGGGAPKREPTQQEIVQSRQAVERFNQRVDDGLLDLERDVVDEADTDFSAFLGGRASADVAQSEIQALRTNTQTGATARGLNRVGNSVNRAANTAAVDAVGQARSLRDSRRIGAAKVGEDIALNTSQGLAESAKRASRQATSELQNDILRDNSRTQAILTAAGGAAQGAVARDQGFSLTGDGLVKKDPETGEIDEEQSLGRAATALSFARQL